MVRFFLFVVATAGLLAVPAAAHHSAAMFDAGKRVTLTGTVQDKSDKALAADTVENVPGVVSVKDGRPVSLMSFTVSNGAIAAIDIIADPDRLPGLLASAR